MKINSITITLTDIDDVSAGAKVVFDPPITSESEIEDQPVVALFDYISQALEKLDEEDSNATMRMH